MLPAVSVVVPLFNKGPYVARALRSVLAQTFQDFEVIVVDDGSTDEGPQVVRQVGDARIRLVAQANAGVSAARNRGVAEAKADLVAFLDADDQWMPRFLETIVGLVRDFPECGVFATGYVYRDGCGRERRPIIRGLPSRDWRGVLEDYFAIAARSDPPIWSSAVCVRKAAIQSIGGFPVGIGQGEDLLTWARLAIRYRVAYSHHLLAVFWRPGSESGMPTRRPEDPDRVGQELLALARGAPRHLQPPILRYVGLWHKMRGTMYVRLGQRQRAIFELGMARHYYGSLTVLAWLAVAYASRVLPGVVSAIVRRVRRPYRSITGTSEVPTPVPSR